MVKLKLLIPGIFVMLFSCLIVQPAFAITADQQYFMADANYIQLKEQPAKQKSRRAWVNCIEDYQKVYTDFPESSWAPAGMYRTAELLLQLYELSLRSRDKTEALDLLKRVQGRYPESAYSEKARQLLTSVSVQQRTDLKPVLKTSLKKSSFKQTEAAIRPEPDKPLSGHTKNALKQKESSATPEPRKLLSNSTKNNLKQKSAALGPEPEKSLTNGRTARVTGLRFWSNPEYSRVVIDASENLNFTEGLIKRDPATNLPQRLYIDLENSILGRDVPKHTAINDDLLIQARAAQNTPLSVRVVIDIKSFESYKIFSLKDPFKLMIDVWAKESDPKTMPPQVESPPIVAITSTKKATIRNRGKNSKKVRSSDSYTSSNSDTSSDSYVSSNSDNSSDSDTRSDSDTSSNSGTSKYRVKNSKRAPSTKRLALAKQLSLGVRKIIIDPGHGGKDPGAPGVLDNIREKDVVLKISKRLASKMRDRLQCEVILTRSTDTYLTLEERTAIANTKKADLFISLHCNAANSHSLTGIETYFLNLATDDQSIAVAARENATSRKNISDLESILNDLMKNAKINESSRLATKVQGSMCNGLARNYSDIRNLGVKQAPFYVLLGARMPSILIETSFLSNRTECRRLVDKAYQERLCDAIIDGVAKYINETNPGTL